jgi:hypothetical protein
MAPNAPCSVLALISIPDVLAAPPMAEETAKPTRPVMKTRLRPVQEQLLRSVADPAR